MSNCVLLHFKNLPAKPCNDVGVLLYAVLSFLTRFIVNIYRISVNFYLNFKEDCCLLSWTVAIFWILHDRRPGKQYSKLYFTV